MEENDRTPRPMYEVMAEKNAEFEQKFAELKVDIHEFKDTYTAAQIAEGRNALNVWESVDAEMDRLSVTSEFNRYLHIEKVQNLLRNAEESISTLEKILRQKSERFAGDTYNEMSRKEAWEDLVTNGADTNVLFRQDTGKPVPVNSLVLPDVDYKFVDADGKPVMGFEVGNQERAGARKAVYIPSDQEHIPFLLVNAPEGEVLLKPRREGNQIHFDIAEYRYAPSVQHALTDLLSVTNLPNKSPAERGTHIKNIIENLSASYREKSLSITKNWQYALEQLAPPDRRRVEFLVTFDPQNEQFSVDTDAVEAYWSRQDAQPWDPTQMPSSFVNVSDYKQALQDSVDAYGKHSDLIILRKIQKYEAIDQSQNSPDDLAVQEKPAAPPEIAAPVPAEVRNAESALTTGLIVGDSAAIIGESVIQLNAAIKNEITTAAATLERIHNMVSDPSVIDNALRVIGNELQVAESKPEENTPTEAPKSDSEEIVLDKENVIKKAKHLQSRVEVPEPDAYFDFRPNDKSPEMLSASAALIADLADATLREAGAGRREGVSSFLKQSYVEMGNMDRLLEEALKRAGFVLKQKAGWRTRERAQDQFDTLVKAQNDLRAKMQTAFELMGSVDKRDQYEPKPGALLTDADVSRILRGQNTMEAHNQAVREKREPISNALGRFGKWVRSFAGGRTIKIPLG